MGGLSLALKGCGIVGDVVDNWWDLVLFSSLQNKREFPDRVLDGAFLRSLVGFFFVCWLTLAALCFSRRDIGTDEHCHHGGRGRAGVTWMWFVVSQTRHFSFSEPLIC